jgi:hypothetical protein
VTCRQKAAENSALSSTAAWSANKSYGIRIGKPNRDRYFDRSWPSVKVEIDNVSFEFSLSPGFWRNCPEIRGKPIAEWFRERGLVPWHKGRPPAFELIPLSENCFRLVRSYTSLQKL